MVVSLIGPRIPIEAAIGQAARVVPRQTDPLPPPHALPKAQATPWFGMSAV